MLVELRLVEQRYQAVLEVLDGATVVDVARRFGVARQTVHVWLGVYASHGLAGLAHKSSRPLSCPHQMAPEIEARIVAMRGEHPGRGPRTILYWLEREGFDRVPGRTSVERCLIRHGLVIVGGVRLVDRSEAKIVSERLPARGGKPDQSGRLVTTSSAGIGAARHADGRQDADPSNGSPKGKTPPSAATSQ